MTYKRYGDRGLLIEWPTNIDESTLADILQFKQRIGSSYKRSLEDIVIGYHSLTLIYDRAILDVTAEIEVLSSLYTQPIHVPSTPQLLWDIPVCYDRAFGLDLETVAEYSEISTEEVIRLHSEPIYKVYFIGFLPGFLYLGGLDQRLTVPRRPDSRLKVPQGSVAIGGSQTGIYPQDSAGGWNIIGRTPYSFFNTQQAQPCFAKSGDCIRFVPIALAEYQDLANNHNLGEPTKHLWHD